MLARDYGEKDRVPFLFAGLLVRFVSIPTLIRMKEVAGRPRDLDDIQHLRWILEDEGKK